MSKREQGAYLSFLLRLWQATEEQGVVWQASLQDSLSGKRMGFASLEGLFKFLQEKTSTTVPTKNAEKHTNQQAGSIPEN